jgi:hypothetical protein
MSPTHDGFFSQLDQLIAYPVIDRSVIKRVTGAELELDSSNSSTNFWVTGSVKLGDVLLDTIDYRDAVPGGDGIGGALVGFNLGGECVPRKDVLRHYKALAVTDQPTGRSLDEQTYYTRPEPWGGLSFGFAERSPDCLKTVIFDVRPRPKE